MAVWDAVAKIAGMPLHRLLANRYREGHFESKVFVYAAGGYYYPNKNLPALQDEMRSYLALGYSVVKMKIGGAPLAEDLRRIEAVLKILKTPDQLAVDANGRFDPDTAIAYARALAPYGLRWYEEHRERVLAHRRWPCPGQSARWRPLPADLEFSRF